MLTSPSSGTGDRLIHRAQAGREAGVGQCHAAPHRSHGQLGHRARQRLRVVWIHSISTATLDGQLAAQAVGVGFLLACPPSLRRH